MLPVGDGHTHADALGNRASNVAPTTDVGACIEINLASMCAWHKPQIEPTFSAENSQDVKVF